MKKPFKILTMAMVCIAMTLFVSCKKGDKGLSTLGGSGGGGTHEYVDLGLPSGLLWATCNIGAASPEDYGDYIAWGETSPKTCNYEWGTYQLCNGSYNTLTKYCTESYFSDNGIADNLITLEPEEDAAHVNWGGDWRMPTKTEMEELKDNCTWMWTTKGGKNGYLVIGDNYKSIFLPAAGYRIGSSYCNRDLECTYWSSSLYAGYSIIAHYLCLDPSYVYMYYNYRYYGLTVRPVCAPRK